MTASAFDHLLNGLLPAGAEPSDAPGDGVWDDRLAGLAAQGDAGSFGELVRRHEGPLHAMCLHLLGCAEDARDAAQEAFIRAWHALSRYEIRGKFRAWLWCIAVNLCRDRLRVRKRRQSILAIWQETGPGCADAPHRSPDETAHWRAEMEKLARGLDAMPDKLRWPLLLCALEGLPQSECAIVLGTSTRAVEGKVRRAREWLLDWWSRHA
jgi:RNA polymerase sigma factor (sigma-70 family)